MADVTSFPDEAGVDFEAPHKQVHLASEQDLARDYADFEVGAVPPFGAGTHEQSVRLKAADLLRLTKARVDDISKEEPSAG
jgi:prolyl-tRNA editing enzyme YbaK/EbsC (Cys-tRNA(Pro) deacylase)